MRESAGPLPPALFLAAIVVQVLLHLALPAAAVISVPIRLCGGLLLVGGLALTIAADAQFKRARTEIHPFGQPSAFVEDGAFWVSRNPMYLGLVVALIGIALLLGSVAALVVPPIVAVVPDVRFIRREEQTMTERFGDVYLAYARLRRRCADGHGWNGPVG